MSAVTQAVWAVELHRAEALWLSGGDGPLARKRLPGTVTHEAGGTVLLDQRAFRSLCHLGCLDRGDDGRIIYDGELPVLVFGNDRYVLRER